MEAKELFQSLVVCNEENSVTKILKSNKLSNNQINWIPLGNNKNNASIVQNTAGSLGSCLTELTTNAIDAVIQREKESLEKEGVFIPYDSLSSPEKFLSFVSQHKYNISSKDEGYAKHLQMYAKDKARLLTTEIIQDDGAEKNKDEGKRSVTVIDAGCGQAAANFANTFCSVGSGHQNKANKSWQHGNYGQGSTSGNAISGIKGYKLIVSRENTDQNWGFTVIRRNEQDPSMLEYLVVGDSNCVYEFPAKKLEVAVRINGEIAQGDGTMLFGSAVKLFSVKVEKGFTGVKRTIGGVFMRPALPISSFEYSSANEKSKEKKNGRDSRWINGLGENLDTLTKEIDPKTGLPKAYLEEFCLSCPAFKGVATIKAYFIYSKEDLKKLLDWLPTAYTEKNKRFFHINNGQVQHTDSYQKMAAFFPKAAEHIFIEADLSNFDPALSKAYLWKADRTSFQTSSEHFQLYDKALESFLKESEVFKGWEKLCAEAEMSKLKSAKNLKSNSLLNSVLSQFSHRDNKVQKATKKLIQSESADLDACGKGMITEVSDNIEENENKVEVEGKEIPSYLQSENSSIISSKKSSKRNLSGSLKTDAKKGSVGTKDSNNEISIKSAKYIRDGLEHEIDKSKMSLSFRQGGNNNNIEYNVNTSSDIQNELKVGDSVIVEFEMTNKQNKTFVLNSVVYFELVEALRKVDTSKKSRSSDLSKIVKILIGTKDGRKIGEDDTIDLTESGFEININKAGYYVVGSDEEETLSIILNFDNHDFLLKKEYYKKDEDKKSFIQNWQASLIINVLNEYEMFLEEEGEQKSFHALATKISSFEKAYLANKNAIQNAVRSISQEDMLFKHSLKAA